MKNIGKMEIIFATNNPHKLFEVRELFSEIKELKIISLSEAGINANIPETGNTLEENSLQKARYIHKLTNKNVIADDTGLEVVSLNNLPGVYSARYAGENCTFEDNINKLLFELKKITDRRARFKTVASLIYNTKEYIFEGVVNGTIIEYPKGDKGFGYDPIFLPDGYNLTFAEMDIKEKNKISHRAIAFNKLFNFLKHLL